MTPKRNMLRRFACLALALVLCLSLGACRGNQGEDQTTTGPDVPDVSYTLQVGSVSGAAMPNIEIYIYENDSLQDLVAVTATDESGKATFTAKKSDTYVAVLLGVPDGYVVAESYPISGADTEIVLDMELVDGDLTTAVYQLGDVMQDFTFTDCNGNAYTLSELLQTKKAVVLNFWKLDGLDSKVELPCLQKAYEEYADTVAVLCMDPVDTDNSAIAAYAKELGITLPIGACESEWGKAMQIYGYPTTVVIDRFGVVAMNNGQPVKKASVFTDAFAYFTAEDYVQKTVDSIQDLIVTEADPEEVENPDEIIGTVMEFKLTLDPGQLHYVRIPNVDNIQMQVHSADVYVEYGNKKFYPSGGTTTLLVSAPSTFEPALVGFCNQGEERITFRVTLYNLPGTYENPYSLKLGQFSTSVSAGNNQGVHFTYTAAEDGNFTLQCLSVSPSCEYQYSIMNMSTSVMRNSEYDAETDETGKTVVSVPAKKGQKLLVIIGSLPDDNNKYPAATFQMLAAFDAGEVEEIEEVETVAFALTVTDENRKPLAGVSVSFTPDNPTDLSTGARWITDENGVASGRLPKDGYTVSAVIPNGYKATTTRVHLTPEAPMASLKFENDVIVMQDYSVHVSDPEGKPVENALVVIGDASGFTNSQGVFTANLEKGEYTAMIQKDGYELAEQAFAKGSAVLNVKLTLESGDVADGIDYTVTVTDYTGTSITGITVSIYRYGTLTKMATVNDEGIATFRMKAGTYTVGLTSVSGAKIKYEALTLTAKEPSGTVKVAAYGNLTANRKTENACNYYTISTGSTWADLTDNLNSYEGASDSALTKFEGWTYAFIPTQSGIYHFTVSEGALLGYFGSNKSYIGLSGDTNAEQSYIEVEITESQLQANLRYLLAVKSTSGADGAVISVQRVGDVEAELPTIYYENKVTPTKFKLDKTGTLQYVDVTGTATVTRGEDGFYYLNGKQLYLNIGKSAPYVTFAEMVGMEYVSEDNWSDTDEGTGVKGDVIEDGKVVAVEQYNEAVKAYIRCCDPDNGLYPLTDDLVHILKMTGARKGWWDEESPTYLFEGKTVNTEIAWLFACCTVE